MLHKKNYLLLLFLLSISTQSQVKKTFYYYQNQIVTIKNNNRLEITSDYEATKYIGKTKDNNELYESIGFDSFSEISDIEASTYNLDTKKKINLSKNDIRTTDGVLENIYKSDYKKKSFMYPGVTDNSTVTYRYTKKFKEPKLLEAFYFENGTACNSSSISIIVDNSVEIGYKLFGLDKEKVTFTEQKGSNNTTLTWELKDIPEIKSESEMPSGSYILPHLVFYIKSAQNKGVTTSYLGTPALLYKWYSTIAKEINKTNQDDIKAKTLELIKDKKTDLEKAKTIYDWVQENLNYVAFEDGMGGFVPRNASEIYTRKFGDCKDMANITCEMLKFAGLKSHLVWIGTRHKNYTYEEVPSPIVDNHMIACVEINGKKIFLDATGKYIQFPLPTDMIQGKEALIGIDENNFEIVKVPEIDKNLNTVTINSKLKVIDNSLIGESKTIITGTFKSSLAHYLANNYQKEKEIWKRFLINSNEKIILDMKENNFKIYENSPATATFDLKLSDWVKQIDTKIILKPILFFPLKDDFIDLEKRKFPIEKDIKSVYNINYEYAIPEGYKVEFLPANNTISTDLIGFTINYTATPTEIKVQQEVFSNVLLLENKDFEKWNGTLKKLINQYNQSIIFVKK